MVTDFDIYLLTNFWLLFLKKTSFISLSLRAKRDTIYIKYTIFLVILNKNLTRQLLYSLAENFFQVITNCILPIQKLLHFDFSGFLSCICIFQEWLKCSLRSHLRKVNIQTSFQSTMKCAAKLNFPH